MIIVVSAILDLNYTFGLLARCTEHVKLFSLIFPLGAVDELLVKC